MNISIFRPYTVKYKGFVLAPSIVNNQQNLGEYRVWVSENEATAKEI